LLSHSKPERPCSKFGADLFELYGKQYLILVDYYSGFFEVDALIKTTSSRVIECCKSQFSPHGIPDTLITDIGPQFTSYEFKAFVKTYNIKHCTSSPYYLQSNGMAEKWYGRKMVWQKISTDCKEPHEESSSPWK